VLKIVPPKEKFHCKGNKTWDDNPQVGEQGRKIESFPRIIQHLRKISKAIRTTF